MFVRAGKFNLLPLPPERLAKSEGERSKVAVDQMSPLQMFSARLILARRSSSARRDKKPDCFRFELHFLSRYLAGGLLAALRRLH